MTDAPKIDKLVRAKAKMIRDQPFFGVIAMTLPMVEAPWCKTMATDYKNIYYGKEFVDNHSEDELAGVIAHEVLHVAFLHGLRRGNRDPKFWNYACDAAINPVLKESGFTLPNPHIDEDKFHNKSAGEIYEMMCGSAKVMKINFKIPSPDGGGKGQGDPNNPQPGDGEGDQDSKGDGEQELPGGMLEVTDGNGNPISAEEAADMEAEIKIKVENAVTAAKSVGKLPGSLQGLITALGKPKINWQDYLQMWIKGRIPDDYTWQRPNRRYMAAHRIYLPTMELRGCGTGILSVDTSGSVSDQELKEYVREIAGVIDMCKPDKVYIVQHDSVVQRVDEFEAHDDFSGLKISGRGGTCIQPVFKFAEKLDEQIDWMVCFTDMGICDFPNVAPEFPVLWAATGEYGNPSFGQILKLRDAMDTV